MRLTLQHLPPPYAITEPGCYRIPADAYHLDPCPDASLNQSTAKVLLERSPAHAWHQHPALNPQYQKDGEDRFDLGSAAHAMLLGEGRSIEILPFGDYRSKDAKAARDLARQAGKIPMLAHQAERAGVMVIVAKAQVPLLTDGISEAVLAWREGSIWLRTMIDKLDPSTPVVRDYKTTDFSVAPQNLDRLMINGGWDVQAAFQERAIQALFPDVRRVTWEFVAQETEPPHAVTTLVLTEAVMTMGRKKVDYAIRLWSECMSTGKWPSYPPRVIAQYPSWAETAWLNREIAEAAE